MSRLFVTGDTHQSIDIHKLSSSAFKTGKSLTKKDIVTIMGDAGFVWSYGPDARGKEKWWRNWISNKPWTTFCVLGNHEAYSLIEKFPIVSFCGAPAYKITDSLFYAITGEIYDLNGYECLVVNGAESHDIVDAFGKPYRKEGISWWPQEKITQEDVNKGLISLAHHNDKVDYIFSHTGGTEVCRFLGFKPTISDIRLDKILNRAKYKKFYCGHYHCDKIITPLQRIVYNDIILINSQEEDVFGN